MRLIGFSMLISGFLWIAWDCAEGFVEHQHALWILQTQHLPPGESIKRTDAAGAMRQLSLDLKDRHREILLPSVVMLAGGLILGFNRKVIAEPGASPNGGPVRPLGNSEAAGGPPSVS
jgi:hypothetical protein